MAFLIGDASTTRFSSTYGINSGASANAIKFSSNIATSIAAGATGTAQNIRLYISSWGSQTNIKVCLYAESDDSLLESVIVPSSVGTGVVTIALAGTTSITSAASYSIGIYTEDADDITLYTDTAASAPYIYNSTSSGNYTTPMDPRVNGGFDSFNEYYWAIDDDTGGGPTGSPWYYYAQQ